MLPHLDLLLAHLRHMSSDLASVLAQTKRKRKKPWKNRWKPKVFGNHLGARLAHLGGYVGPSWGYVGPSWGYLDPAWGLCWPILTLCWPILGPCWPSAYVGPCWPILSHKAGKMQEAENTVKRGTAHGSSRGRRQGRDSTLSFGEERCLRRGRGQVGPLAGFKGLRPTAGQGPKQRGVRL